MNRNILTPYFLDELVPGLADPPYPAEWVRNHESPDGGDRTARMISLHQRLAQMVADALQKGFRPVSVAGDCCSSLAVLAGLRLGGVDPQLIWFDAHGDFNTPETSPSGFLGGMPLAMLVGRGDQSLVRPLDLKPLAEERVILTDGRDLDPLEREALRASEVKLVYCLDDLLEALPLNGPIWVHYDTDIVSASEVPAQNYPAHGGPSAETLGQVFDRLAETGRVAAVSVSTWNPELPGAEQSRSVSVSLLKRLLV